MTAPQIERRKIAVYSVGRSDFGRYLPVLRALDGRDDARYEVLVGGAHFDPKFGPSVDEIEASGVAWSPVGGAQASADTEAAVGAAIAEGARLLAARFADAKPDLLLLSGDRYEMLAGAVAALGFDLPVVHLHGGAVTEGAVDERVRHALTKMSHYHLVVCEPYARRVRQMGEEAWRVEVTGAPGLDGMAELADRSLGALSADVGIDLSQGYLLVCFHPVTVEADRLPAQLDQLIAALDAVPDRLVLTYPNADLGHSRIIAAFEAFGARNRERAVLIDNAGTARFLSLLRNAAAIVGNSSAGIVEAATFATPTVNIGTRQDGKLKPAQVIDCGHDTGAIVAAIAKAKSAEFRSSIRGMVNPYGDGHAGPRIAKAIAELPLGARLMRKKFIDA